MTAQEKSAEIERDRRSREEALLVLLLLLIGTARRFVGHAIRLGADPQQAMRDVILGNPALSLPGGAATVAAMMAGAHIAGWKRAAGYVGNDDAPPDNDVVLPNYRGTSDEPSRPTADAILLGLLLSLGNLTTTALAEAKDAAVPAKIQAVNDAFTRYGWTNDDPKGIDPTAKGNAGYGAARVATTAILPSYNGGYWDGLGDVEWPLQHFTVVDERTTDICMERSGFTRPKSDPYWLTNWPSLHFGCRSIAIPVSPRTTLSTVYPTIPPEPGFGLAPIFA